MEGASPDTEINGICYDSRKARPGDLFVAVRGYESDGHRFIPAARAAGCAAVLCHGHLLGLVPKTCIPNYSEFYEARHFTSGAQVDALLKQSFRPEFLNRLDEIVFYKPLSKTEIGGVVELLLAHLKQRLADRQLTLEVTDAAKEAIIDGGYDPIYGARPLKRFIQSRVETLVAREIIARDPMPGTTLTVDAEHGALVLR